MERQHCIGMSGIYRQIIHSGMHVHKYGYKYSSKIENAIELERHVLLKGAPEMEERLVHFKRYCAGYYPNIEFNPWTDRVLDACLNRKYETRQGNTTIRVVCLTGCATASKTFSVNVFAAVWWLLDPLNSAVVITSTTKDAMSQRSWPIIMEMYSNRQGGAFGNMIASKHKWQAAEGNDKHSILCQALQKGDIPRAIENVKGVHTPRRLIIVDEANETHESILAAIPNARKGCQEFLVIIIGNARSRLDQHGRLCEPRLGWSSLTIDSGIWQTKGISEYQIPPGWCHHFDGEKSPNVLAGKTIWPYLYSWEDHQAALHGGEEYRHSIGYWSNDRGFWPADDLKFTVLSETMIERHQAYDTFKKFVFVKVVKKLGALDPAFGGDKPMFCVGTLGELEDGKLALQLEKGIELKIHATSKEPADYQLYEQVQRICADEKIEHDGFGIDSTGTGRGVAAILVHEWSDQIMQVEFGGAASDAPASETDSRPGNEVYWNRVTELWWHVREAVTGEVIRGIYREAAIQFCGREYEIRGRKYFVVPKDECKKRIHRSPDDADAISIMVEVAKQHGLIGGATPRRNPTELKWLDFANKSHRIYETENDYADGPMSEN